MKSSLLLMQLWGRAVGDLFKKWEETTVWPSNPNTLRESQLRHMYPNAMQHYLQ